MNRELKRETSYTLETFWGLARRRGANSFLIDRICRLYESAKKNGLKPTIEGIPNSGEQPFMAISWVEVDLDGTLTINGDTMMDLEAKRPGDSTLFALQLSEIPAFEEARHTDFLGEYRLNSKLADLSGDEFSRLMALLG